ncbi:hypothetical protein [Pedobacter sp. SYP-B3415]|uniref:hypothetical protein n=1 Tax=Pedobacter sp. SYP-B3415 TaxID=2496641 RepID=UPI001F0FF4CD|nr:hypothetical protein [Pedobacter sp. SYP-B3415]
MYQEKIITPPSGYLILFLFLIGLAAGIFALIGKFWVTGSLVLLADLILVLPGLIIIDPNEAKC